MNLLIQNRVNMFSDIVNNAIVTNVTQEEYQLQDGINAIKDVLINCHQSHGITYIVGNGGSASIASHAVIDLLNMVKLRAMTLHDCAALTCISNDYGYEHVYAIQLKRLMSKNDVLIAISSSGNSNNILNAVETTKASNAKVITLSGFSSMNRLRHAGHINLWLNSDDYGFVEMGHAFILHNITDALSQRINNQVSLAEQVA